jgi:fermentation-respiration switch protein FrsA (DUF1100 family)
MSAANALASFAKIAAAVAIGLPVIVYLVQDRLIFYPQTLADARREDVVRRFPAVREISLSGTDGTRLHAWLVKSSISDFAPLVLYFGGNAEEVSWMLEAIGDPRGGETPGIDWLLADYRGYGASEGSPSERALFADALVLYDYAARLPGADARRTYVFGRSLGSAVAVHIAAERAVAGVILVTPFDSLISVAKHYDPYLPVGWMLKHRFDSISRAPRVRVPLLCFIAEHDDVVPPAHAERLFAAWGGAKRRIMLRNAKHNETDNADGFWPAVREFTRGLQA